MFSDELKIEEVFMNYISNAINHVKENRDGIKEIRISFQINDESIRVMVYNTGDNIPTESLPRLWDKFYKVDKARTREYGGNGVGLSIVKVIMESMKQNYGVENTQEGVVFWFELEHA